MKSRNLSSSFAKHSKSQNSLSLKTKPKIINDTIYPDWLIKRNDFQRILQDFEKIDIKDILKIIGKSPAERTPYEKFAFINWIKSIPFFSKLSLIKLKDLSSVFTVKHIEKGERLEKNSTSGFLFLIVLGELLLTHKKNKEVRAISRDVVTESKIFDSLLMTNTMVASLNSVVLLLTKNHFDELISSQKINETYELNKFIKNTEFFNNWSVGKIENLLSKLEILSLNKGDIVYKINEVPTHFYILKSGSIIEQINVSLNYTNSWPAKLDLKEKLFIQKNYLIEFKRYEPGNIFGFYDTTKENLRETQASAEKKSVIYCFPLNYLVEFLTEKEKQLIKDMGQIQIKKAVLMKEKKLQVQSNITQSKNILNAMEINLRPITSTIKNTVIDKKIRCAQKIVYRKIDYANKELKEVKSYTNLYDKKNHLVKRCSSRDESYLFKSRIIL